MLYYPIPDPSYSLHQPRLNTALFFSDAISNRKSQEYFLLLGYIIQFDYYSISEKERKREKRILEIVFSKSSERVSLAIKIIKIPVLTAFG